MKRNQYQRHAYALRRLAVACDRAISCMRIADRNIGNDIPQRWVSAWATIAKIEPAALPPDDQIAPKDFDELLSRIEASGTVTGLSPDGRWLARQDLQWLSEIMPAQTFPAELTTEESADLAQRDSIAIREWLELTGIGIGLHDGYLITEKGVEFVKWTPQEIAGAPPDWQREMFGDNTMPSLTFPCAPATLASFVSSAIGPNQFALPLEFMGSLKIAPPQPDAKAITEANDIADADDRPLMIAWKQLMLDSWPAMRKIHGGRNPTAQEVIRYLRTNDKSGVIVNLPGQQANVLRWAKFRGGQKTVKLKTIQTTICEFKKKGLIPY